MKFFVTWLATLVVGMAMAQEPEIAVRAPSTFQNCDCQCDSYTWTSRGRLLGNCQSPDATGANFCYVSGIAARACRDVQVSPLRPNSFSNQGKFFSYEACSTPPRNQCFGSVPGFQPNIGEGDLVPFGGRPGGFGGRPGGFAGGPGGFAGGPGGFGPGQGGFVGGQGQFGPGFNGGFNNGGFNNGGFNNGGFNNGGFNNGGFNNGFNGGFAPNRFAGNPAAVGNRPPQTNLASILGVRSGAPAGEAAPAPAPEAAGEIETIQA